MASRSDKQNPPDKPETPKTESDKPAARPATAKASPRAAGGSQSADEPAATRQRYIISHRTAHYHDTDQRHAARDLFDQKFRMALGGSVDMVRDTGADDNRGRRVIVCEADAGELMAKAQELSSDSIIEPELKRTIQRARPHEVSLLEAFVAAQPAEVGTGASLALTLVCDGAPLEGAKVNVYFAALHAGNPLASTVGLSSASTSSASGTSDAGGRLELAYDATLWIPTLAVVEPHGRGWNIMVRRPIGGMTIEVPKLPRTGPLGWWHALAGIAAHSPRAGEGIRVGVIDSGVGPHPYLDHVIPVGAFLDGSFTPGAEAARDAMMHGTHVSGIIGARPAEGSGDYAGLAPGAEIFMARVFPPDGDANQGDIANAIDTLSISYLVDLINMSLGGAPSQIEFDAVLAARQHGTLCICAAGNDAGQPVSYPAAYPGSTAVTALGLLNTAPANSVVNTYQPTAHDRYGMAGTYLAAFSNVGPQVAVTAGGNGIISTIPAAFGLEAPYTDMSGTSMAAPVTTGALAALLSRDPAYKGLPRGEVRAEYARRMLQYRAVGLGLSPLYQGAGVSRAV